jgi:hypothetical protein
VEIYVSKKRKQFSVPKDLLIYYSGYFERRLDPSVKKEEAGGDQFHFLDDDADNFALIVDYIYRGAVISVLPEQTDVLKIARCLSFISLAGKLEIGEAASVIYPVLTKILSRQAAGINPMALIAPEFIRTAFTIIPTRNNVLKLLAQAAMPETMKKTGGKYDKLIEEVEGFAAESWRQFKGCSKELHLAFPLNRHEMKHFTT